MAAAAITTIDKGIPVPPHGRGCGRPSIYPFREMEVGDSFLVPCAVEERETVRRRLIASKHKLKPKNFITRNDDSGVRVWRTA